MASHKKIVLVRCEGQTHTATIDRWVVVYNNGVEETYDGETPPTFVARFCKAAKYGYKDIDGTFSVDWYSTVALSVAERKDGNGYAE